MNLEKKLIGIDGISKKKVSIVHESTIILKLKTRRLLFIVFSFIFLIINTEEHITALNTSSMMLLMDFNQIQFVHFKLIVSIGKVIGGFLTILFFNWTKRKQILLINLFTFTLSLLVYFATNNNWFFISVFRFLQGVTYIYPMVYAHIWIDQFCSHNWKYIMIAMTQVAILLSKQFGSLLQLITKDNWKLSFSILGLLLFILAFVILNISSDYFNEQYVSVEMKQEENEETDSSLFRIYNQRLRNNHKRDNEVKSKSFVFEVKYWLITISKIALVSTTTVLELSMRSYMIKENISKNNESIEFFDRYCLFWAPIVGVLFGGVICQFLGKNKENITLQIIIVYILVCVICSYVIPITTSFGYYLLASIAFIVFSYGSIPLLIGLLFSCVSHESKGRSYVMNFCLIWLARNIALYYFNKSIYFPDDVVIRDLAYLIWIVFANLVILALVRNINTIKERIIDEPEGIQLKEVK